MKTGGINPGARKKLGEEGGRGGEIALIKI